MKHLKLLLKTLFSNNACVEASRTKEHKYGIFAVIFAVLAVFFAVLPLNVNTFKKAGSDWLNNSVYYNMDIGLQAFSNTIQQDKNAGKEIPTFIINQDETTKRHYLTIDTKNSEIFQCIDEDQKEITNLPRYICRGELKEGKTSTWVNFLEIYYCDADKSEDFNKFVTNLLNNVNPNNTEQRLKPNKDDKEVNRSTSFIVFGKYSYYGYMYQPLNTSAVANTVGDYDNTAVNTDLIQRLCFKTDMTSTINEWKSFCDEGFINLRFSSAWNTTGIMIGVDFGVIFFMGVLVFLLTRGKNNPFRIYSFWDSQKIAYYSSLTPGLLALLGLMMSNMAMMFFILFVGVRVMWLSMRTLRYQAPAK